MTDQERAALAIVKRDFKSFKRVFLVETVRWQLTSVSFASARYRATHGGNYPDFAKGGWRELADGGYLDELPWNPLSPSDVATKLVVIDDPELTARDVDRLTAGWVWHSASSCLMAAGFGRDAGALHVPSVDDRRRLPDGPMLLARAPG